MTALPAKSSLTGSAVTQAGFKTALDALNDYLSGLLGTSGLNADARGALGLGSAATRAVGSSTGTLPLYETVAGMVSGSGTGVIPSGTVMLFRQSTAPVGWTQQTDANDRVLRVINGGTASFGGSWTISGMSGSTNTVGAHSHTGATGMTALTESQIPSHVHLNGIVENVSPGVNIYGTTTTGVPGQANANFAHGSNTPRTYQGLTSNTGGGAGHNHGIVSDGNHAHTVTLSSNGTWRPPYIDVIAATKD